MYNRNEKGGADGLRAVWSHCQERNDQEIAHCFS